MFEKVIHIGDKVDISRPTRKKGDYQIQYYVSQVLELNQDKTATLSIPIMNRHIVPLEVGGKFDMCFYTKSGLYQCQTVVLNRSKLGNIYVMGIEFLTDLEKLQRRQYYRLDWILDLGYRKLDQEEYLLRDRVWNKKYEEESELWDIINELEQLQKTFKKGSTSNISGGGLKFMSAEQFEKEDILEVSFKLDGELGSKKIETFGRVVSCIAVFNRSNTYEIRLEFIQMDRKTKEAVVRLVFNEERRRRKRGGEK